MFVQVYETTGNDFVPVFKVYYENGELNLDEVPEKLRESWERFGLIYRNKRLTTEDGEKFLRAVSSELKGSMLRASEVMEE